MFGVPKTSEFTKPPGSYELCGFSYRKNQEKASKFGSILGCDRGSVNNCSAAAGGAPNWTGRTSNSSYESRRESDFIWVTTIEVAENWLGFAISRISVKVWRDTRTCSCSALGSATGFRRSKSPATPLAGPPISRIKISATGGLVASSSD